MRGTRSSWGSSPVPPTRENLVMGNWPFLINLDNRFRDKFSFWYPVSELLDYKKSKNIAFLFLKHSHSQLWNFSSILIHSSGIYVEKWYPEKRHILHRFIWKSPPTWLCVIPFWYFEHIWHLKQDKTVLRSCIFL